LIILENPVPGCPPQNCQYAQLM